MKTIAFIGFGEVAARFCAAATQAGARVIAYDVLIDKPGGIEKMKQRTAGDGPEFMPLQQLLGNAYTVLSTVTTDVALDAARACVPHLDSNHVYVDLNATSPAIKREIGKVISATGAAFVEGAILGAVGVTGARTRILVCGERAEAVASTLSGLGLNVAFYGTDIGRASTFKLLRSIFSKGVEALLLEAMLAARRADMFDDVWREIVATLEEKPFAEVASNWMVTHGTAHERRYHEMVQAEALVKALGVEPLMTEATTAFFARSTQLGLAASFAKKPSSLSEVVAALDALACSAPVVKNAA